jgi:hypothetical protein
MRGRWRICGEARADVPAVVQAPASMVAAKVVKASRRRVEYPTENLQVCLPRPIVMNRPLFIPEIGTPGFRTANIALRLTTTIPTAVGWRHRCRCPKKSNVCSSRWR